MRGAKLGAVNRVRLRLGATGVLGAVLAMLVVVDADAQPRKKSPPVLTRISRGLGGAAVDGNSSNASMSANGRFVAFESDASDLVTNDGNGTTDVFVRDLSTGKLERVSVSSAEGELTGSSSAPDISADGRYVAFVSDDESIDADGGDSAQDDVFVRDRSVGETRQVSVRTDGTPAGNGDAGEPSISADGRFIAFDSDSTNLVAGDTNAISDVFRHNVVTGDTDRISLTDGDAQATGGAAGSFSPAISANGSTVAFPSSATDLIGAGIDTNARIDVFVRSIGPDTTDRVSVSDSEAQATGGTQGCLLPSISADGVRVAFSCDLVNLVSGDTNGDRDVFVRDRQLGTTVRASVHTGGLEAHGPFGSVRPSLAGDGRSVAFVSDATDLVDDDTNNSDDVFLHDLSLGDTRRISLDAGGVEGSADSTQGSLSRDGRRVAFSSEAPLVPPDPIFSDVFVRRLPELPVACGAYIYRSMTLTAEAQPRLRACAGDGLTVAASNVKLDLGGLSIGSDAADGDGIRILAGFTKVTIRNGGIRGFDDGVSADEVGRLRIERLTIAHTANNAMDIEESDKVTVRNNRMLDADDDALELRSLSSAVIDGNTVLVTDDGDGIDLNNAGAAKITRNRIIGADFDGIDVTESPAVTIERNVIESVGDRGIAVAGNVTVGRVSRNSVRFSDTGIQVTGEGTRVVGNVVRDNDIVGMVTADGVIDGGGNRSQANGNLDELADECVGVVVCGPVLASGTPDFAAHRLGSEHCDEFIGDDPGESGTWVVVEDMRCIITGLTIAGPNVTLDLGGHTIADAGVNPGFTGIVVQPNTGVIVRNGTIRNFEDGVSVVNGAVAVPPKLSNLTLANNEDDGLVSSCDGATVSATRAVGNGNRGFLLQGEQARYSNLEATANAGIGFHFEDVNPPTPTVATDLVSRGNVRGFVVQNGIGTALDVRRWTAFGNLTDGFRADSPSSTGVVLREGNASFNSESGLDIDGLAQIGDTVANDNMEFGFDVPLATTLGGNTARGNGDTDCTAGFCT